MLSDNPVFRRFWAWQYDGTNHAPILASAQEWETMRGGASTWDVSAQSAGAMTLRRVDSWGASYIVIPAGMWLLCNGDDGPSEVVTDAFYRRVYRRLDELWTELGAPARLLADQEFVAGVTANVPVSFLGTGVGRLAAILLGSATATVDCQVRPPLPAGLAGASVRADPIVGGITVTGATNQGNVATATAGGVTTLAHTLVRATVQNTTLLGIALGTPVVLATVHV